jgi:hypothetical protein
MGEGCLQHVCLGVFGQGEIDRHRASLLLTPYLSSPNLPQHLIRGYDHRDIEQDAIQAPFTSTLNNLI